MARSEASASDHRRPLTQELITASVMHRAIRPDRGAPGSEGTADRGLRVRRRHWERAWWLERAWEGGVSF